MANKDSNIIIDPDITFDKHGHAYIHVNGRAYRYEYADTVSSGEGINADSGDTDAVNPRFRLIGNSDSGDDQDADTDADG
jgi:hypothetical protein